MIAAALSRAQEAWLLMAEAEDGRGVTAPARHVSLNALRRRGLVEPRHCRSSLDNRRWVATFAGREWARERRVGTSITPSSLWQGTPAPGSRWTVEQLAALAREGVRRPETIATATVMRRPAVNRANWEMPPEPVPFILPQLARTRDGRRAKVVTPAGRVDWYDLAHHRG